MRSPDIIGVEEMENLTTLQALPPSVNADAIGRRRSPIRSTRPTSSKATTSAASTSGFLVKTTRVDRRSTSPRSARTRRSSTRPTASPMLLNDRPPLVLRAERPRGRSAAAAVTVIVNHLRSLDRRRRSSRRRIACARSGGRRPSIWRRLIQSRQAADPAERIISVGDFNAFQFNDGYVDVDRDDQGNAPAADQVVLASADLVNPNLMDLVDGVPAIRALLVLVRRQRPGTRPRAGHDRSAEPVNSLDLQYGRMDADFPEVYRNDPNRPERVSDHDPLVAYFSLAAMRCEANGDGVITRPTSHHSERKRASCVSAG